MADEKIIQPLIYLAPRVFVLASEIQLVMGLYEALSGVLSGDRTSIYKTILNLIRFKLTSEQCQSLMNCMQTAIDTLEIADKLRVFLSEIVQSHQSSAPKSKPKKIVDIKDELKILLNHDACRLEEEIDAVNQMTSFEKRVARLERVLSWKSTELNGSE